MSALIEDHELVERLNAYIDGELDAALSADVERLIAENPEVAELTEQLRTVKRRLEDTFKDVASEPLSPATLDLIQTHGTEAPIETDVASTEAESSSVIPLHRPSPVPSYGPMAAAASIAFFIAATAWLHQYDGITRDRELLEAELAQSDAAMRDQERELASVLAEQERLVVAFDQAEAERDTAMLEQTASVEENDRLRTEQAVLEGQLTALGQELERATTRVTETSRALAQAELARDQTLAELGSVEATLTTRQEQAAAETAALRAQLDALDDQLLVKQGEVGALTTDLVIAERQSASLALQMTTLAADRDRLEINLADLRTETRSIAAERSQAEVELAEAQQRIDTLLAEVATVASSASTAAERAVVLEDQLAESQDWMNHIAQYHRIYARVAARMPDRLVEVPAAQQPMIEQWLGMMLKRPIPVPDLSILDVTFEGARLLAINEKPVAQLMYLDPNGEPLAFCITPEATEGFPPKSSTSGDLNLLQWRDGAHAYALVGWSDPDLLSKLVERIRPAYGI